jgi:transitional endoplasmic reticulum ATPase
LSDRVRLRAFGRVDLDGTHRAVIEADRSELDFLKREGPPPLLRISNGDVSCGCMLTELSENSINHIYLDRYKMRHLDLRDGDEVGVEELPLVEAEEVSFAVPRDFNKGDFIRFIGKPLTVSEKTALFSFSGEVREFQVKETRPAGIVVVKTATAQKVAPERSADGAVSYEDIGGLNQEIKRIREIAEYPFRFPKVFKHLGVSQPRGIILHGPPGTGKTLIAKALAAEAGARFYSVSGPEIYSKWYGKSEETLRNIFDEAVRNAPAIVVIDELDALVPRREKTHGDQEQRIVATFLTQMDGLKQLKDVVVLGTTNRLDAIDPALRRGGRFECEIYIGPPAEAGREEILKIHTRGMPIAPDVDFAALARSMTGYVGADIASLCREAAYNALRRSFTYDELERFDISIDNLDIEREDFELALTAVQPSGVKGFPAEIPPVTWDDIGGLDEIKQVLIENIAYAIDKREAFERVGVTPARGILLYGPPGTGKTLLARAVATECGANFFALKGGTLRSRWLGEAEEQIHQLFSKARLVAPTVIFIDEIDAAVPRRGGETGGSVDAVVNQILAEMDGIDGGAHVYVIGATNRLELLDPAVLRPGRFDFHIEVPVPNQAARRQILGVHLRGKPLDETVDVERLAAAAKGLSGADLREVCRDAAWSALREAGFQPEDAMIGQRHLDGAIEKLRKTRKPK